jgi:hypothetical protein
MKWEETVAFTCRYGDVIGKIFEGGDVIWENSMADYQGYANVLAAMPDGSFIHYEWTYGSCSGCDEWEARGLSDEEIWEEVKRTMAVLPDIDAMKRYLRLEDEYENAPVPTANSPTNGSLPGMMRFLCGGYYNDFVNMKKAFIEWNKD